MSLRPRTRRLDPADLDTARKLVSRAERRALQRAEELRAEAEQLLKSASSRRVDLEREVRTELETELEGLRREMEEAGRRATIAENELELLRARHADLLTRARDAGLEVPTGDEGHVPPLQVVGPGEGASAGSETSRLHARAELELARARQEALAVLATATAEAEDLLSSAVGAIERETAITAATREQAERDGRAAAARRQEMELALVRTREEADRLIEDARAQAGRIVVEARREAAEVMAAVRAELESEIIDLRDVVDRTRDTFGVFLGEGAAGRPL